MSSRFALIIANTEYIDPGFAKLTAPGKDAQEFARVLRDHEICAFDDVKILMNQPGHVIREEIEEFFNQKKPENLLVLYFSGLGVLDEFGAFYLAVKNTSRSRLRATGIKSDFIRDLMDQSRSKRQVLILDCCNSGAFAQGTKAAAGVSIGTASAFEAGFGRIILTSSDSIQFAWEDDKVIGNNSLFTHYLVEGLEGEADRDGDGRITVDELYDYAFEKVKIAAPKQTPSKFSSKQQGEIVLRQSTRIENIKPLPLPSELIDEIEDTRSHVREAAVQKLEKIISGRNIGLARSAREALEKISAEDDSQRVAQAATQVLDERKAKDEVERIAAQRAEEEHLARIKAEPERRIKEEAERLIAEERRMAREKAAAKRMAKAEEERLARGKAEAERKAKEMVSKEKDEAVRETRKTQLTKNFKISIVYPKLLSKRFESAFLLQIYVHEERYRVTRNIKSQFREQQTDEQSQSSSIKLGQRIRVKLFSPAFDFPESVTKLIDNTLNKITFLGMPKDICQPGSHKVLVSVLDVQTEQEFESFTINVQVVDFAFDHVSRPLLSRASAVVLGIGSFAMFILTFLEQIDKTVGLTSGAAAGVLALGIYASFYNLYQRVRPNMP